MGNSNTIEIRLTVKDDGSVAMQKFGTQVDQTMKQAADSSTAASKRMVAGINETGGALQSLKGHYMALSVAAVAAWATINKGLQWAEIGAYAEQTRMSFQNAAKAYDVSAAEIVSASAKAAAGTVGNGQIMQKAMKAMTQDVDPKRIPDLFAAARVAARTMATDVSTAADSIIDATANQMPKALRQMGLITRDEMSLFTKAIAAGITDVSLLEFVLDKAAIKTAELGVQAVTAAEEFQRFHVQVASTQKLFGQFALVCLKDVFAGFSMIAAVIEGLIGMLPKGASMIVGWGASLADKVGMKKIGSALSDTSQWLKGQSDIYYDAASKIYNTTLDMYNKNTAAGKQYTEADIEEARTRQKAFVDDLRKRIAAQKGTSDESARIARDLLAGRLAEEKQYYDRAISEADNWLQIQRSNGAYEMDLVRSYYDKKISELDNFYKQEKKAIEESGIINEEKTKRIKELDRIVSDARDKDRNELTKNEIAAAKRNVEVVANAYKTLGEYSDESMQAQIAAIEQKYKMEGAFVKAGTDEAIALEKAKNTEIFNLKKMSLQSLLNPQLSYLETVKGLYSDEYKAIYALSLKTQADLLEKQINNANGGNASPTFDKAAWIAAKQAEFDQKELADKANFYSTITGFESEYRSKKLGWIDEEQKRLAKAYNDDVAAAKWAAQEKGKLEQELFEKKTKYIADGFGDLSVAFDGISKLYAEGSSDANRWKEASNAMLVAQKAVAVVNAVATIANQGLGDPYTAFARIAAMAAAMGALLASSGIAFGGGASVSAPPAKPASTVLGAEEGTGSASFANSYKLMEDTYDMQYRELSDLNSSMRELNQNITGLVSSVIRTGSVDSLSSSMAEGAAKAYIKTALEWVNATAVFAMGPSLSIISKFDPLLKTGMGWLADIGGWIYGGESKTGTIGQGLGIDVGSIGETRNNAGLSPYYWTTNRTTTSGWFGSSSNSDEVVISQVNEQTDNLLHKVFTNLGKTIYDLTDILGGDINAALAYTFGHIAVGFTGKTAEEISKELSEAFSGKADEAIQSLLGDMIGQYQQLGEGLYETATRLAIDKVVILDCLEMTGNAFTGTGAKAIAMSESLISLAGGLDKLRTAVETYYDKFFTDAEKQAKLQADLTGAFAGLGMSLPASRAGFRSLVEGIDLSTTAGQKAYVSLMSMAGAADQFYTSIEASLEAAVGAAETALKAAFDAEKTRLNNLYQADLDALNVQLTAADKVVSDLTASVEKLKSAKKSMALVDEQYEKNIYNASRAQLALVLQQARGGNLSGISGLDDALKTVTADNSKLYRTAVDYQRAYWQTYSAISELEEIAGKQLTDAQKQVLLLKEQIKVLGNNHAAQIAAMDTQLNALLGINTSVLSIADAIAALAAAVLEANGGKPTTGGKPAWGGSTPDAVTGLYQSILGRTPDSLGYAYWQSQLSGGMSVSEITARMMASAEYQNLKATRGYAFGGISTGPDSGYEATLHGTELIVSPRNSFPATVKGGDNVITINELRAIRQELAELKLSNQKIATYTQKTAALEDEWNETGMPATRV